MEHFHVVKYYLLKLKKISIIVYNVSFQKLFFVQVKAMS